MVSRHWVVAGLAGWIGFLAGIILLADSGRGGWLFSLVRPIPEGDKVGHFILFGVLGFLANLALRDARVSLWGQGVRKGSLVVAIAITLEECSQAMLPSRTFDVMDLAAGVLGVWAFGWVATRYLVRESRGAPH